MVKRQR